MITMKAVILAGGSGERFWPLSTSTTPKQFLRLFEGKTLLRQTYERIRQRFEDENIIIITSRAHLDLTHDELPELPEGNIIGEPQRRNTGPACVAGALMSDPDEIDIVLPADHHIPDTKDFWRAFDLAISSIRRGGGLFTFGITPTRPDTGYGYMETGEKVDEQTFKVKNFKEKPDEETAEGYLKSGNYYWNSGMFIWKAGDLIRQMQKCSPDIMGPMMGLDPLNDDDMDSTYSEIPSRSIDYAVMERSDEVRMVLGEFIWSDVGSWDSIRELEGVSKDEGTLSLISSEGAMVRSTMDRPVGIVDVPDITVVDSPDGLLICRKGSAQKVRDIIRKLG